MRIWWPGRRTAEQEATVKEIKAYIRRDKAEHVVEKLRQADAIQIDQTAE